MKTETKNKTIKPEKLKAIPQTEALYHNLFEANPAPLVALGLDGIITDVNQAMVNMAGCNRQSFIGSDFGSYFTEAADARNIYKKVFTSGPVTDHRLTLTHKNGSLIPVLFSGSVYNHTNGSQAGVLASIRHMPQSGNFTKDCSESETHIEHLAAIIESSDDAVITKSVDGIIKSWNKGAETTFGFTASEAIGKSISMIIPEEYLPEEKEILEKLYQNETVEHYETVRNKKGGEEINVSLTVSPLKDSQGNIISVYKIARDITSHKKLQKELMIIEAHIGHLAAIVESSDDAIISKSLNGIIKSWNKGAEKIFGYEAEEAIGSHITLIIPLEYQNEEKIILERILDNHTIEHFETLRRRKDGRIINVSLTVSPLKDKLGTIIGISKIARDITEQKEASYARSLIEASLDPLITISLAGKVMDFNNAFSVITGINREQLIGSDFFEYFTEPQKASEVYQEIFAKGSVADSPLTLCNKEGNCMDVLFNGSVYKDERGNVLGAVVVARDIAEQKWATDLRKANQELAFQNDEKEKRAAELGVANTELAFQNDEKEKRAQELSIANKELAFQNDEKEKRAQELSIANKELAFQNDEKEKRAAELGIANTELAFQNDEKEKRAQELSIANKELAFQNDEKEKRAQELSIANKELAYQNDEKEKRAAELAVANKELAFQNEEKEKRAAELVIANKELAYQNDEKVKRAAELRIANYARSLIEASRDPLVTISPEGKITDTNQATVNITGTKRKKLINSDFFDYFTEPQKAREVYQEVFAKGSVADSPLTLRHKDGKLTDVLFNGSVYKNDEGHVLGVVIVARDVTDQKRIATELRDAKEAAEQATRNAEEAKAKAEHATLTAEDAVKAKQQFLSNMSHEIRTPMNAIVGFTKVVLKTELSDKQKEYVTAIKQSGDALIVLINDILDLAKVDAGKMTFEQIPFKLSASISSMIHLFETKIQEKNLELVKEYDPAIPEVLLGDPVRLHQIILNLVSNAVKFTSEGKITVGARMITEDAEKVTIQFSVTDTGIGIKQNKLAHIFDDFQQATSGTSRLYGGTGLGLAIVKNLVEPQGGSINVKSKAGEGSTFSFTLSFNKTLEEADCETGAVVELVAGFKDIKVLVVEDIALNQLLMKTLLEDFGFEMDIAGNGKIALEMLQNNTYDIILMDLQMPEMNGFEATEYIRNTLQLKVPIIALTADVTTVDVEKCKAVGMNDYISKPIDDKLLYTKIIKYLKDPEAGKNPVAEETESPENQAPRFVNFDYLKRITKNNVRMAEMIQLYLQEIPDLVQTMKKAIEKKDWESLKISTHSIIPTFATIGVNPEFEDIAKAIQAIAANLITNETGTEASDETMVILGTLYLKIETVCEQAAKELKEELVLLKEAVV